MGEPTIDRFIKEISSEHGNMGQAIDEIQSATWNVFKGGRTIIWETEKQLIMATVRDDYRKRGKTTDRFWHWKPGRDYHRSLVLSAAITTFARGAKKGTEQH